MKKLMPLIPLIIIFGFIVTLVNVIGDNEPFITDLNKTSFNNNYRNNDIKTRLDKKYSIKYDIKAIEIDTDLEQKLSNLGKRTTYLFLGNPNQKNQNNYRDYNARKNELINILRYSPKIPKDKDGNLIQSSSEYKEEMFTGISIPGTLKLLSNLRINYKEIGIPQIFPISDNATMIKMTLHNVSVDLASETEPQKVNRVNTNLTLIYIFKKYHGEYKLYYVEAQTSDEINKYLTIVQNNENSNDSFNSVKYIPEQDSLLYNYSLVKDLPLENIKRIYDDNHTSVVILSTYNLSGDGILQNGTGFFIGKGIIVTTWNYVNQSLINGSGIIASTSDGQTYTVDGLISVAPELNIAILKISTEVGTPIVLGDASKNKSSSPVMIISSDTGNTLSIKVGIFINYYKGGNPIIQSGIPVSQSNDGSPLFNTNGEVIGINTSLSANTNISIAKPTTFLLDFQNKIKDTAFKNIPSLSLISLKKQFYYPRIDEQKIALNKKTWYKYKNVGDIENSIIIPLIKANYYNKTVSLRYLNEASSYISTIDLSTKIQKILKEQSYKLKLKSSNKIVFENDQYQFIILTIFNYLEIIIKER